MVCQTPSPSWFDNVVCGACIVIEIPLPLYSAFVKENRVEIRYCTECRWLLRSAWMAQELLTTFAGEISELALQPDTGGVFEVRVNGTLIWSRAAEGRFPDVKELKQLVRDHVAPGRDLGHSENVF